MPRALGIAFLVTAVLVNIVISRGGLVADTQAATWSGHNTAIVNGLHVALPSSMKYFPPERVPLP
jgi:hypothetical protein